MPHRKSLRKIPLFQFIDASLAIHLNECATLLTRPQGQALILEGEPVAGLYVIDEGEAEVYLTQRRLVISTLGPGEVFGEMSLLEKEKASATIRAKSENTSFIFINGQKFSQKLDQIPELSANFYKGASLVLSSRLRKANNRIRYELESLSNDSKPTISSLLNLRQIDLTLRQALSVSQNLSNTEMLGSMESNAEAIKKLSELINDSVDALQTLISAYFNTSH